MILLWWVKRGLGFVLRFLFRSFSRIMSCFFNCFRIRDHRRHLPTSKLISTSQSPSSDVVISQNRLSSLFQSQEKEDSAGKGNVGVGSQGDDQGLRDEAKFLKACGTLGGTPAEIQKVSRRLNVLSGIDSEPSGFHSWLPSTSVEKLQLDVKPFGPPTPIQLCQESGDNTDSLQHTPSSCISNAEDTQHESPDRTEGSRTGILHSANVTEKNAASISPWPATDTQRKNKSVRFECETDFSSCGKGKSPYPTPLKLFEEMQTPGTVYPASLEDLPYGKPRVRSQFVFPVNNPGENLFRCKILEEKDFDSDQVPNELSDSFEQAQNATTTPEKGLKTISNENEYKEEASLSSCLKPASITQEEKNKGMETAYSQTRYFHKTPAADRPIIGVVAAHWNEDDDSHISRPKWWDGNGIPNSTTKYKEDQKVNWHATPFEERLEKALSEGSLISQRKLVSGKPVEFDENEESDTALSQLQSSNHAQSVVSF